jgi:hypothetical protein
MARMTKTFGVDARNDIHLNAEGDLAILSGIEAVAAACRSATLAQLGEMVYATRNGIPNFQTLWKGAPDYSIWKSYILKTLQGVEGVREVTSLVISPRGDSVSYIASITTNFGATTVNG